MTQASKNPTGEIKVKLETMTKEITKQQVLKALRNEPLEGGQFFANDKPNCNVCAVGAVLREVSFETWFKKMDIRFTVSRVVGDMVWLGGFSHIGDWRQALKDKQYLSALSIKFEKLLTSADGYGTQNVTPRRRQIMIDFVERYFPTSFTVTLTAPEDLTL